MRHHSFERSIIKFHLLLLSFENLVVPPLRERFAPFHVMANPSSVGLSGNIDLNDLSRLASSPLFSIIAASSRYNIQPLAILALKDLGVSILADVDLIQKAKASFDRPFKVGIRSLKICLGLSEDPVSKEVEHNSHFAAAFLLAVGCKTIFTVDETATLLHYLVESRPFFNSTTAPSVKQLAEVICHINGYGDLIDTKPADEIWTELSRHVLAAGSPTEIDRSHSTRVIAEIVMKTFEALQETENDRVIIRGCYCGLFVATIFLWLCPSMTACAVDGDVVYPLMFTKSRLLVDLVETPQSWKWRIVREKKGSNLSESLAQFTYASGAQEPSYPTYYPLKSAKDFIQRSLDGEKAKAIGVLATSFLEVAFQDGKLVATSYHRKLESEEKVRKTLSQMCPDNSFANNYSLTLTYLGWDKKDINTKQRNDVTEVIRKAISMASFAHEDLQHDPISESSVDPKTGKQLLVSLMIQFHREFRSSAEVFKHLSNVEDFAEIIEYSVYIAAHSLLLFIFNPQGSEYLKFQPPSSDGMRMMVRFMERLLAGHDDEFPLATHERSLEELVRMELSKDMTFLEFRSFAMGSMLPGRAFDATPESLAVSENGYVAYEAILETFAEPEKKGDRSLVHENANRKARMSGTSHHSVTVIENERQAAWAIWVIPGRIIWDDRPESIKEISGLDGRGPHDQRQLELYRCPINPFDNRGTYRGFDLTPARNHNGVMVQHLVGISGEIGMRGPNVDFQHVSMIPYIAAENRTSRASESHADISQLPTDAKLILSWTESIQAWAFAEYIEPRHTSPRQEEDNAKRWKSNGYFSSELLQWCSMDRDVGDSRIMVTATGYKRDLRFFEAGNAMLNKGHVRKLYIRHEEATFSDCLATCMGSANINDQYSVVLF